MQPLGRVCLKQYFHNLAEAKKKREFLAKAIANIIKIVIKKLKQNFPFFLLQCFLNELNE